MVYILLGKKYHGVLYYFSEFRETYRYSLLGDVKFDYGRHTVYPPYSLYVFTSVREEGDEEIRMYDMVYT